MSILQDLIPRPNGVVIEYPETALPLSHLTTIFGVSAAVDGLCRQVARFRVKPLRVERDGVIEVTLDSALTGWQMEITASGVRLAGGSEADCCYAALALAQLVALAARCGEGSDALPCGKITDCARYSWRAFMIDSARHFQSVGALKSLIGVLSTFRFNVLHWHLTDSQGWRVAEALGEKELAVFGDIEPGQYSREDIAEVIACAQEHHIEIVPEFDLPGHNFALCRAHPELACDPAHPGNELCLGKAEVRSFIRELLRRFAELFPSSRYIHIGGDEADSVNWKHCEHCAAALRSSGCADMRELENHFMREMAQSVLALGRTPMVWTTAGGVYPAEVMMQAWFNLQDILRARQRGNRYVYSVHSGTYLDYPSCPEESAMSWMQLLDEEGVYITNVTPFGVEAGTPLLQGVEYCLWTELIPEWRLMEKVLPRLWAASEVAWGSSRPKECADLIRRRRQLELSGYRF